MVRIPKYRRRRDRDSAFVEIGGHRVGLPGRYDSHESLTAYHKIVQKALAAKQNGRKIRPSIDVAVVDLVGAYLDHAKLYYLPKNGQAGGEYDNLRQALRPLLDLHGETAVEDFGPLKLKEVREAMIAAGLSRGVVNARINRIRRAFRWGVENELLPAAVSQALDAVSGLRKGKTTARECRKIEPAPESAIDAVLPLLTPVLADMVRVQRLTGMRSENLVLMRACDIERTGDVWLYRPAQHKEEHHDQALVIPLGPKCQAILGPYLDRPKTAFLFSPQESELQRRAAQRAKAVRPGSGAHRTRPGVRTHYNPRSYRRALWYAIRRANKQRSDEAIAADYDPPPPIPHWHPHQLRHSIGTEVRRKYRTEAARVYLGHARMSTTEIYAERDLDLARQIAREIG